MSKEKTLCPLCWQEEHEEVKGELPCTKCQEDMKKGFLLIGVDYSKSETTDRAVRTGHRWIVKPKAAQPLYTAESFAKGAGLIDLVEAKQLGLPVSHIMKPEKQ